MESEILNNFSQKAMELLNQMKKGKEPLDRVAILDALRDKNVSYEEAFHLLYELDKRKEEQRVKDYRSGVFNAEFFETILPIECGRSIRMQYNLSMIIIDIDDFRNFNNNYSYLVGNKVIYQVAQTAKKVIRRTDIVCRYGGEEFVVLCPASSGQQTVKIAEKIREAISDIRIACSADKEESVTVSCGVAEFNRDIADVKDEVGMRREMEVFLEKATEALHQAKGSGKNKVDIV